MSALAYNLNGEPFEVPPTAGGWRVRRLKNKGAPEVVYGREGTPLVLPIDADIDDLRREARHEGKYRVDVVDEQNRPIPGCPAGYVCLHEGEAAAEPVVLAKPTAVVATADQALIEAMRIQAGLAQAIVEKFSTMLEASAVLLRAAENAGMPRRLPRFFFDPNEEAGEQPEETAVAAPPDEPNAEAPKSMIPAIIESVVSTGTTALINAFVDGKIKIPGGIGALIDCRRAVSKDRGAAAPATHVPGVVPAPGPRDPAPAGGASAPLDVASAATSAAVPRAAAPPSPAITPASSAADPPAGLPIIGAETMQHFQRILDALTLEEQMHAQAIAAELSPEQLRAWVQDLQARSVEDGAATIRAFLRQANRAAFEPRAGGAGGAANQGDAS